MNLLSPSFAPQRYAPGTERVVYTFKGGYDATYPYAGLIAVKGTLYSTTLEGGAYGAGTVFAVSTSGKERVVYSFKNGTDGSGPYGGLIAVGGELYGTTGGGGAYGVGTVFAVSMSGKERVLHSFGSGNDGNGPFEESLIAVGSELYGTTMLGGASGYGTVFEVSTSGKERVVYSFGSGNDGAYPYAGLIAVGKELYGTTDNGGASNFGTVFEVSTSGKERVLHSFGTAKDGSDPEAPLIAVGDELYGTTAYGGAYNYASYPGGTVFEVSTSGKERVLHSFGKSSVVDGIWPYAGLVTFGSMFYGTTLEGGTKGVGTVFSISTSGSEHVLHSFYSNSSDGFYPYAGLVAVGSELYGTTAYGPGQRGGGSGYGTVFKIVP